MQPIGPIEIVRRLFPCIAMLAAAAAFTPAAATPQGGDVLESTLSGTSPTSAPPFIDGMDGIATRGLAWDPDPAKWGKSALVAVRGAQYGESVAMVKLRIEGKGDPVIISKPQQGILVTDNSGSMGSSDPGGIRCQGMREYVNQMAPGEEIGVVYFDSADPARLATPLTANVGTADTASCSANGGTNFEAALKTSNTEMFGWGGGVDKRKPGFQYVYIFLSDGCDNGYPYGDDVNNAVTAGVRIFTIGLGNFVCDQALQDMATISNGKYFKVTDPKDLVKVYLEIKNFLKDDLAGKPPRTGAPMMTFGLRPDIEVVPATFRCESVSCIDPLPASRDPIPGNKGLVLQWNAPVKELRIGQYWQVSFGVRSFDIGKQVKVNEISRSFVEYDRYDGSPGGTDTFEQLYLDVNADIPPCACGTGLTEPPSPPPPPPHGGIPQLIPNPQSVPVTYIQNLPVLHGVTVAQGIPLQYLLGSAMGLTVADRVKLKSRIRQGVKVAMASM